jgi:hypothetical protein
MLEKMAQGYLSQRRWLQVLWSNPLVDYLSFPADNLPRLRRHHLTLGLA